MGVKVLDYKGKEKFLKASKQKDKKNSQRKTNLTNITIFTRKV